MGDFGSGLFDSAAGIGSSDTLDVSSAPSFPITSSFPDTSGLGTGAGSMSTSDSALLSAGVFPDSTGILGGDSNSNPSGSSASGFLSGLGDLFAGIGQGVGAGIRASNIPKVPTATSGWQWNPTTGTYYNPTTGQSMTATGTITSLGSLGAGLTGNSGTLILLALGVVAFLVLRKKE